jgi:hypothetical protein
MKGATAGLSGLAALVLLLPMEATCPVCIGASLLAERVPALAGPGPADEQKPGDAHPPGKAQQPRRRAERAENRDGLAGMLSPRSRSCHGAATRCA